MSCLKSKRKKVILKIILFLITVTAFSQQQITKKITTEICDTLSMIEKPIEELSNKESKNTI